ncbi:hypothetical protein [Parabacteroides sp. FAFU027]|uniref:hypothetical protein n=1 Tax=Parabacteroides sp. FAFU027 TaxID=2922715 RepID=UPI001FAEE4C9|nr:hypothetical protein [Parabacteroides sp. FAFU027]
MTTRFSTRITLVCLLFGLSMNVNAQDKKKSPFSSYLFVFFSNNTPNGEQLRFALSDDGFNYYTQTEQTGQSGKTASCHFG